jgi:hypothetical protein
VATTPNFGLPCPDGGDPPCEGAQQIQALAEDFQSALNSVLAITDHATNIIGCLVSYQGPLKAVGNGQVLAFNTVELDTGGFADLSAFPNRIFFPRQGRYLCGAGMTYKNRQANGYVGLTFFNGPFIGAGNFEDRTAILFTDPEARVAGMAKCPAGTSQQITCDTFDFNNSFAVTYWMWAFWISDY